MGLGGGGISDQISLKKTADWTSTPSGSLYLHRMLNLSYDPAVRQEHVSMFPVYSAMESAFDFMLCFVSEDSLN